MKKMGFFMIAVFFSVSVTSYFLADNQPLQDYIIPSAFASDDCDIPEDKVVREFNLTAERAYLPILGHNTSNPREYPAMTFNQQIPGPTLRVIQGDIIKTTITVPSDQPTAFSINMHSAQIDSQYFAIVNPGESKTFCHVAEVPGVFSYHGKGVDYVGMDQHVLSGMYGMVIVEPLKGYKKLLVEKTGNSGEIDRRFHDEDALEFQLQYSQLYLTPDGRYDASSMFMYHHTGSVVNGMQFGYTPNLEMNKFVTGDPRQNIFFAQPWNANELGQYQGQPLFVPLNEHVRFFVLNQGIKPLSFGIDGEILDRVVQGNRVQAQHVNTWELGTGENAIVDVVFDKEGIYTIANRDLAQMYTGAASMIIAGEPFSDEDTSTEYLEFFGNPCDAIPPAGISTIPHPKIIMHGLYSDERAEEMTQYCYGEISIPLILPPIMSTTTPSTSPPTNEEDEIDSNAFDLIVSGGMGLVILSAADGWTYDIENTFSSGGTAPYDLVVDDFDNDGNLDVVVCNSGSDNIAFLAGTGTEIFGVPIISPVNDRPVDIDSGDFDNDGNLDVVVSYQGTDTVSVLLGTGTGTFGNVIDTTFDPEESFHSNFEIHRITIGDFDNDGNLDVVVANTNADNVSVLFGTGTGTFGNAVNYPVGNSPMDVTVGDFDGDGNLDLVTGNLFADYVSVLRGIGTGEFEDAVHYIDQITISRGIHHIAVGYFDKDVHLDVAGMRTNNGQMSIMLNNNHAGFTQFGIHQGDGEQLEILVEDINGDGKLDLATPAPWNGINMYFGTGTGEFEHMLIPIPAEDDPRAVKAIKVN